MIKFDKTLISRHKPYYLAFSGGIDSLAAAAFLSRGGYDITLFHVVHNYNRQSSWDIELGVRSAAIALNLPLKIHTNIQPYVDAMSPEQWCAYVRYDAFSTYNEKDFIICHHLDDVCEKYIMNCCVGKPKEVPYKVASQLHTSPHTKDKINFAFRPFLMTKKEDFARYLDARSNLSKYIVPDNMVSHRGVLREEVMPHLPGLDNVVKKLFYS